MPITMKYVLVFVLLTCVLSASIKERMETAAVEKAQEGTFDQASYHIPTQEECLANGGEWEYQSYWYCHYPYKG